LEFGKVLEKNGKLVEVFAMRLEAEGDLTVAAYPTFRKPVPPSRTVRLLLVGGHEGVWGFQSTYRSLCHGCDGQSVLGCG
jgi:hypothetical protein